VILLAISAAAYALFLSIRNWMKNNPDRVISYQVKRSKYANLLPYIIAQAKHETGGYTSINFMDRNNLFGMKRPEIRPNKYPSDQNTNYLIFPDLSHSIKDLINYFDFVGFPTKVGGTSDYVAQLKRRKYFTAPENEYLNGVNTWMN